MCEIFPEVEKCALCVSLRVGMVLISVLCIMTGVALLSGIVRVTNANYEEMKNITDINDATQAVHEISKIVRSGIMAMSLIFIVLGFVLLFSTLGGSEGFVQIFVWGQFLNVIFGFLMTLAVVFECTFQSNKCILSELDWLSASIMLVACTAYLFLWIYFICVANSYVING